MGVLSPLLQKLTRVKYYILTLSNCFYHVFFPLTGPMKDGSDKGVPYEPLVAEQGYPGGNRQDQQNADNTRNIRIKEEYLHTGYQDQMNQVQPIGSIGNIPESAAFPVQV